VIESPCEKVQPQRPGIPALTYVGELVIIIVFNLTGAAALRANVKRDNTFSI